MAIQKLTATALLSLSSVVALPAAPLLSEFMAINDSSLADENGDFSDWIEIYNPDASAVNLLGWHLTDKDHALKKWTFPSVSIPAGGYLVVFASEKNRAEEGSELHTNFKLSGGGEFLALVMPDGLTPSTSFSPYPSQVSDVAYGINFTPQPNALLPMGASYSVHVPNATTGPILGDGWRQSSYVENSLGETWISAESGVGFGSSFSSLLGAGGNLESEMLGIQPGAYLRAGFQVANLDSIDALTLRLKYDDGFVAYLNGEEIARDKAPLESNNAPPSGLVALYDFDGDLDDDADEYTNGSGNTADDLTPTGSPAYEAGVAGLAVNITASGLQRLRAPDSDDLDLAPNWTLEAFVKPDSDNIGEWDRFWTKWDEGGDAWHWSFRGANNGHDLFINGTDNILNHNSTATIPSNVWSHVALVGNQSAGTITAWINGAQVGTTPWKAITTSGGAMNFGNFTSPGGVHQFSGLIDEAAIWSIALTPGQLAEHAAAINGSPSNSVDAYGLTLNGDGRGDLDWQSVATSERGDVEALDFVEIDLTSRVDLLQSGENLLAIHGLNSDSNADHFLILPELEAARLDADLSSTGYLSNPSPGGANPPSTMSLGPIISTVAHTPLNPDRLQSITVTCEAGETLHPVDALSLTYRVNFGSEVEIAMTAGGAGSYSAVIPSSAFNSGDMVRWKITANDTESSTSVFPAFTDPNDSPEYLGTVISDPATTSSLPILHWFVRNPAAAETGSGTRASISYNGEFYDNVFVRIRGDTARSWPKKSYKFDFNDGHQMRFEPDLPRVKEININTTYTDKSYSRTILAYETFRDSGSPYSVAFPLRMEQNGGFYSVAHFVEQPDRDYLRRNGLDDRGALYKVKQNSIQGVSTYRNLATTGVEKKTRREEEFSDLQALIDNLALTGESLENYLYDHIDIPAVVNNLAANVVIQNIDRTYKNFYLYRDTEGSGEWMILPWDVDLSFGPNGLNTNTIVTSEDTGRNSSHPFMGTAAKPYDGLWNGLIAAMMDRPDTQEMFLRRIRTLGDRHLNSTYYEDRLDELSMSMGPDVLLDRSRWGVSAHFSGGVRSFQGELNRIKNEYLPGRRTHLFNFHGMGGVGIASSQPSEPAINFGEIEFNPASGNQDQEFIELTNTNDFAVDVSGWQLTGGVNMTLKPGSVIPANKSLFLTPAAAAFRSRSVSPTGGEGRFVQGGYSGKLSNFGEILTLTNTEGTLISETMTDIDPSDAQRFLVISEFHYHPAGEAGEEFIELTNISDSVTLDLTGVRFVSGVTFEFSGSIAPGAQILIVRDQAAFELKYGSALPVVGEFEAMTSLNNGGETIKLEDATNSTIQEFKYSEMAPWPLAANGGGASLVLINPTANPDSDEVSNWRPSAFPDGNPGATDTITFDGNAGNDLIAHALFGESEPRLTIGPDSILFQFDRDLAADDVHLTLETSTDLDTWHRENNMLQLIESNYVGNGSQQLTYRASRAAFPDGKFFIRFRGVLRTSP